MIETLAMQKHHVEPRSKAGGLGGRRIQTGMRSDLLILAL
jgi:hypothetical protein